MPGMSVSVPGKLQMTAEAGLAPGCSIAVPMWQPWTSKGSASYQRLPRNGSNPGLLTVCQGKRGPYRIIGDCIRGLGGLEPDFVIVGFPRFQRHTIQEVLF